MRNSQRARKPLKITAIVNVAMFCLLVAGCGSNQQDANVKTLRGGYDALDQRNFNAAMTAADQVLANSPNKTLPAEAHYLRGRVFEERAMSNPATLSANLQQARTEYIAALGSEHTPDLEANARAGIANVAFHQDDYATALAQWQQSYDKLKKSEFKLLALYRMGQAAQRLGRWDEADKYFELVEQSAPGSDLATNARQRRGARNFIVEIPFPDARQADAAAASLTRQGIPLQHVIDPNTGGQHQLRSNPVATWQQAQSIRQRVASAYPNATIIP
jgi:tetratricopeptide (TPR) repeat protein